jgi:RNA polymerase sigma factor (sigma-70 family)
MSEKEFSNNSEAMQELDLIQRAKRGDMGAFEQLVYRYDKQVLSIAARYVQSSEDAKDIYQEVFMRVHRSLSRFQLRSRFSTWLFRITTNVCLSHRSRRKRHMHTSLDTGSGRRAWLFTGGEAERRRCGGSARREFGRRVARAASSGKPLAKAETGFHNEVLRRI